MHNELVLNLENEMSLSRTQPTPEIENHAKKVSAKVGVTTEEEFTRSEIVDISKHLMEGYKSEFGVMGTGHLKDKILDISMSEEEEKTIRDLVRERDMSPYRIRVEMWKKRDNPTEEEIEKRERVLGEMSEAADLERRNLGMRTAGQIFSGEIIGSNENKKVFNGCGDASTMLLSEMKALGINANEVHVVNKKWIDDVRELDSETQKRELEQSFHGHALVRIYPPSEEPILVIPIDAAVKSNGKWDKYDAKEGKWVAQESFGPYYLLYEREEAYANSPFDENTKKHIRDLIEQPDLSEAVIN